MDISRTRVMSGMVVTVSVLALPVCWQPLAANEVLAQEEKKTIVENTSKETKLFTQPLAVPSFSWLISGYPNRSQSAYRLLVANSESALLARQELSWDSGKVINPEVRNIRYSGDSLAVTSQYFWQVEVWAQSGKFLGVSNVGRWDNGSASTGHLTSNIQMNMEKPQSA